MGLGSKVNLSEPIVIQRLDARCLAVMRPPTASHTALAARGDRGRPLREETQRSRPRAASPV